MSDSLGLEVVAEKARICGLATLLAERAAVRKTRGAILLAMMGDMLINGNGKSCDFCASRQKSMSTSTSMALNHLELTEKRLCNLVKQILPP